MSEMTRICVDVPKELSEELMSIISRYEGVPVEGDEPFDVVLQKEALEERNRALQNEIQMVRIHRDSVDRKYDYLLEDAKLCLQSICNNMSQELSEEKFVEFMDKFTDDQLDTYELRGYIKEKTYEVVEVDVTMEATSRIKVAVPVGTDVEDYLNEMDTYGFKCMCESSDNREYTFEIDSETYDDPMTGEQLLRRYSQEELFVSDEVSLDLYGD